MDSELTGAIAALRGSHQLLDTLFYAASAFASWVFILIFISAVSAAFLASEKNIIRLTAVFAVPFLSLGFNFVIRFFVSRQRPFEIYEDIYPLIEHAPGNSFPSNHAGGSFAVFFALYTIKPSAGIWILPVSAIVSFARVYAGLHFISDILAGIAVAGLFWAAFKIYEKRTSVFP